MAKIIVSCRFKKNPKGIANLVKYIGTREGVEKMPDTGRYEFATKSQMQLVQTVANKFPASKRFLELNTRTMISFRQRKTRQNTSMLSRKDMPTELVN